MSSLFLPSQLSFAALSRPCQIKAKAGGLTFHDRIEWDLMEPLSIPEVDPPSFLCHSARVRLPALRQRAEPLSPLIVFGTCATAIRHDGLRGDGPQPRDV